LLSAAYAASMVVYRPTFQIAISLEALLSFAVSIMLGVRINQAYNRWWEARTQWGKLVNISRNLVIKLRNYSDPDQQERIEMQRLVQGFSRALKNHLRGETNLQEVRGFSRDSANPQHVPAHIVERIYKLISRLSASNRCTEFQTLIIDAEARELLEVAGACERIKNTLMPPSFPAFLQFSLGLVILSLPLELSRSIGWYTVPATILATVLLCGGESIAYALERPFGIYTDDLDLESYCNGIDKVTAELLDCKGYAD
jgi:putative membrane protein